MNNFAVRLFYSFEKVNFYTIHFDDSDDCETDIFFNTYKVHEELSWDLGIIAAEIERIGKVTGALIRKFRGEGNAHAIPDNTFLGAKIRLYCYRVSDQIVVLGNGGLKTARTAQEGEFTAAHFKNMKDAARLIQYRIDKGSIVIENNLLLGNLNFVK